MRSAKTTGNIVLGASILRIGENLISGADLNERISKTAKFYAIDLADATPVPEEYDRAETCPSLEQTTSGDLAAKRIQPLRKTLLLNSDDVEGLPEKVEGIAVLNDREMLVLNDSDFGIEGANNILIKVTFGEPVLK
jgi:hypothetical protein